MALQPGTRFGPYEIAEQIGKGGMGEVYRATDTKLGREVAIKILPSALAQDPDRLARFEREAKLLATLNHPHIASVHSLDEHDGTLYLAMELVEGETLEEKLKPGPLPVEDALILALQIAQALEAAHDKGVIHRDLKPANIMVNAQGQVKVLDFGLAKAFGNGPTEASPGQSPALSLAMTQQGMILGTAGYMSPEQASGQATDQRADIWAFGVVLYEMLTGLPLFSGESVPHILAAVLQNEPNWNRLPKHLHPRLRLLLERCLKKKPHNRYHAIADARIDIEDVLSDPHGAATAVAVPIASSRGTRIAWLVAAVALIGMAVPAVRHLREAPPAVPPETRTDIVTPYTNVPTSFALSPNGEQIVFVASDEDGGSRLWLRSLSTTTAQPLAGTEGAQSPFWSPDSQSVAFFVGNQLQRLDLGGGSPRPLAEASGGRGGTWNADGVIVFARDPSAPLFRVPAGGGSAVALTTLAAEQRSHRVPFFLPDGQHFLFYTQSNAETQGIYLGALDATDVRLITLADTAGVYLASGWLLWVTGGTLVAQRLDLERQTLSGDPVTLADGVTVDPVSNASGVSVSTTGLVAYRAGGAGQRQLTWFDRAGKSLGMLGDPDATLMGPSVSPDGQRAVVDLTVQGNRDLWLLDGTRTSRLTFDAAIDRYPIWSPEGRSIAFGSTRGGIDDLYQKPVDGSGTEEVLVASPQLKVVNDWSTDGRFLLYYSIDPQTNRDLWVRPMTGDLTPWVFLKTPFDERYAQFSPDGRFVAYQSNESRRDEIYIRPFTPPGETPIPAGGQWQISTAGGTYPRWSPDGSELYYLDPAGRMMAVTIAVTGATVVPGAPVALFPTRVVFGGGMGNTSGWQYDVAGDGRFLINTVLDDESGAPITLIQNWQPPTP